MRFEKLKGATMRDVALCDLKGRAIARVVLDSASNDREFAVQRIVAGKGALLGQYFGKALREVMLESGDFRMRARLSTTWLGYQRRWFLQLRPKEAVEELGRWREVGVG